MSDEAQDVEKVVVVGSGPAGWTAAIYLARANLSPVVFAGAQVGGQLTTTTDVENFPGFPKGVDGPELMMHMEEQAKNYGARIHYEEISNVDLGTRPFVLETGKKEIRAHTIIICTGASPKMLKLDSEQTYWNRGVHTCAVCDGGFYKGKKVAVIGGGDSAMEEATYLAKLAERVYVVHRRDELRASAIMAERALNNSKIEFVWNHVVDEVLGDTSGKFPKVTGLRLKSTKDDSTQELEVEAMFIAIGHTPNSSFLNGSLKLNDEGYLVVSDRQETSVEGVYAAGDIHDTHYRQAITAAGYGCKAALEVERYLTREGLTD